MARSQLHVSKELPLSHLKRVFALTFITLMGCSEGSTVAAVQRELPANYFAIGTIDDADGDFNMLGGLMIHERAGGRMEVEFAFQSVSRHRQPPEGTPLQFALANLSQGTEWLRGTPLSALSQPPETAYASYFSRVGVNVNRLIIDAQLTRRPDRTFTVELTLGAPTRTNGSHEDHPDADRSLVPPAARVVVRGQLRVGCGVIGPARAVAVDDQRRPILDDAGQPIVSYDELADPTFRTAFCRNALTQLGLQDYLQP